MSLAEEETKASSLKTNEQALQNVIPRIANLSLSSACDDITTTCTATSDNHPIVKPVCNVTEMGIELVAIAATDGVQPILTEPESQVTLVNEYASQGLEQVEEKSPILQQPGDTVISDTKEPLSPTVASVEEAISTVVEVKSKITGTTDVAPADAQGKVGAAERSGVDSSVGQKGASNAAAMPWESDAWVDPFLPGTGEELAQLTFSLEGVKTASAEQQRGPEGSCMCVENLPHKVCRHFLKRMKDKAQRIQDVLFYVQITIDLIEYSKRTVDRKIPHIQEELNMMWLQWTFEELEASERESLSTPEPLESRILVVSRYIIQHLQAECLYLHSLIQGLPDQVQDPVRQLLSIVAYVRAYLCSATSFQDIPVGFLEHSKVKILKARVLLHDILDYVAENITLLWLAEPLTSSEGLAEGMKVAEEANQPSRLEPK